MFHVPVRNAEREPICPVCEAPVEQAGAFCSRSCYAHFLVAVTLNQTGQAVRPIVGMEKLLDLEEQPWYGVSNGLDT